MTIINDYITRITAIQTRIADAETALDNAASMREYNTASANLAVAKSDLLAETEAFAHSMKWIAEDAMTDLTADAERIVTAEYEKRATA